MTSAPLIQLQNLTKTFKTTRAVDGINLSIQKGELFGLVGPDGAGKTTTLRLLAGLLDISEGDANVMALALKSQAEEIKHHVGYMAQQFSLYAELSVLENLHFFAEIFDVPRHEQQVQTNKLLSFAGLTDFKDRRAVHLSGGMQKKLALACTLIHQPEILLLDEPTTGVDPVSRREFWSILTELHLQGTTVIVSTPYMDEADRCSRVGLMYEGRLVVCDTPLGIRSRLNSELIEVLAEDWVAARVALSSIDGVQEVQTYGEKLHLLVDSAKIRLPRVKERLQQTGISWNYVREAPTRMEEAFISMIHKLEI